MFPTPESEVAPAGLWTEPADPTVRSTFAIIVGRLGSSFPLAGQKIRENGLKTNGKCRKVKQNAAK